jgi:hypothetical protein
MGEMHKFSTAEAKLTRFIISESAKEKHKDGTICRMQVYIDEMTSEINQLREKLRNDMTNERSQGSEDIQQLYMVTTENVSDEEGRETLDVKVLNKYSDLIENIFALLVVFEEEPKAFETNERYRKLDKVIKIEHATNNTLTRFEDAEDKKKLKILRFKCQTARQALEETLREAEFQDTNTTPVTPLVRFDREMYYPEIMQNDEEEPFAPNSTHITTRPGYPRSLKSPEMNAQVYQGYHTAQPRE